MTELKLQKPVQDRECGTCARSACVNQRPARTAADGACTLVCFSTSLHVMQCPGSPQSPSYRRSGRAGGWWEAFGALVPNVFENGLPHCQAELAVGASGLPRSFVSWQEYFNLRS